ncbi:MAG: molybdopterin molybdotransferase MoeA [Rhodospirillales bacterium]|nr:molybdopterin molybdotransferase MoeA [Acetobacter sp.]
MVSRPFPQADILSWQEARETVLRVVQNQSEAGVVHEQVPLDEAYGRVLARDLFADRDYPALRRSLRDGFAVRSSDLPGRLTVRGETRAGDISSNLLEAGEAQEIMTGAPIPDGADAVLMVEHVQRLSGGHAISYERAVESGSFVNEQGSEARAGDVLLRTGARLDAAHVAISASVGLASVPVFPQPSVAILSTGDELVDVQQPVRPHLIRNSNSPMLAALVRAAGGNPIVLPVARDEREHLKTALEEGLQADMLLVSGGVSAGRYDLVKPSLRELGADLHFERVRIQPGGPISFLTRGETPVFGLPGNPGSSLVTFLLFARAALQRLGGVPEPELPLFSARFAAPFQHRPGLTRFLPAWFDGLAGTVTHIPWQGSSDVPALARANVFLVADGDRERWNTGDLVRVLPKF